MSESGWQEDGVAGAAKAASAERGSRVMKTQSEAIKFELSLARRRF